MAGLGGLRRICTVMLVENQISFQTLEGQWEAVVTLIYQVAELGPVAGSYRKANISIILYQGIERRS